MKADSHKFKPKMGEFLTEEICEVDAEDENGSFDAVIVCDVSDLKRGEAPLNVVTTFNLDF